MCRAGAASKGGDPCSHLGIGVSLRKRAWGLNKVLAKWGATLYIARTVHHSSSGQHSNVFYQDPCFMSEPGWFARPKPI